MIKLYPRKILPDIQKYLGDETVIVIHGSRQVGKTHLLFLIRKHLESTGKKVYYFDLEYPEYLSLINSGIRNFMQFLKANNFDENKEAYIIIDEVQYLDNPSSFIKIIADHYKKIHLIVSGSSTFAIKTKFSDSLVGRTTNFELFPLNFAEFLEFKKVKINLKEAKDPVSIGLLKNMFKEYVLFGSYPKIVLEPEIEKKKRAILQIIDTYVKKDIKDFANIENVKKFNDLIYLLASQTGQLVNMQSLSKETNLSFPTLQKYLSILEETFVIKLLTPFSKSPSVEIAKTPKVFFYDSGLASLLWLKNFQETLLGSLFETAIFSLLVKKFSKEDIHYWRTKSKQEIDFIITKDNLVIPAEVKLNFERFNISPITSFTKKYKVKDYFVISLDGEKKNQHHIFPWELELLPI